MPFKSLAQEGFLHAHPEKLGGKIHEWDAATKGKHLPEHVKTYDSGGLVTPQKDNSMAGMFDQITKGGEAKPKKEIKEMVHTKSHNGKHIVTHKHHHPAHHPDETHVMNDMNELQNHMDQHAGTPNEGEAAPASPDAGGPAQLTASPAPAPAGPMPAGA